MKKSCYAFFTDIWRGKKSFIVLQISIMTISLVPLVLVNQSTKSMIEEISRRIIEVSSGHISVTVFKSGNVKPGQHAREPADMRRVNAARRALIARDEVQSAFVEISGGGIIRRGTRRTAATIRGVDESMLSDPRFTRYITVHHAWQADTAGAPMLAFTNGKSILLGKAIANELNAGVGDTVLLLTTRGTGTNSASMLPKITRFTVGAVFSTGYQELDRTWVFIPKAQAQIVLPPGNRSVVVRAKIDDPFILPNRLVRRNKEITQRGEQLLQSLYQDTKKYGNILSWYEANSGQFDLFTQTQTMLTIVMLIAVLLAAVTLSSTMGMRVIDLEIDIAVLKALGGDPARLERQLLFQGLKAGVISAVLGIAGGMGLHAVSNTLIAAADTIINTIRRLLGQPDAAHLLNADFYLERIPFHIYWRDLIIVALCAVALSTAAAYTPARRLRNISALQVIRKH